MRATCTRTSRGAGVEIMANSDNVVRGGLTTKHVDVEELLRVVDCTPIDAPVQRPATSVHTYDAPVPEFVLTRVVGECDALLGAREASAVVTVTGPAIVVVTAGSVILVCGDDVSEVASGACVWLPAGSKGLLTGPGSAFVATVPR